MRAFLLMGTVLLAILVAGCGDDDKQSASRTATEAETTSTAPETTTSPSTTATTETSTTEDSKPSTDDKGGSADSADEPQTPQTPETPDAPATPPADSGTGGNAADEKAASATAVTFLRALASGQGAKACAVLADNVKTQIEQGLGQSPQLKGKGCDQILASIAENYPSQVRDNLTAIKVLNVKVNGDTARVTYKAGTLPQSAVPLIRAGGGWQVGALANAPQGSQ